MRAITLPVVVGVTRFMELTNESDYIASSSRSCTFHGVHK
jgi:hypothetical protein